MSDGRDGNSGQGQNKGPRQGPNQQGPLKKPRSPYSWVVFLMLAVMLIMMVTNFGQPRDTIDYSEFIERVKNGDVESVAISDLKIKGEMKAQAMEGRDSKELQNFEVDILSGAGKEELLLEVLAQHSVRVRYEQPNTFLKIMIAFLPWLLIFAVMYFFIFRQFRGAGGMGMLSSFGRSKHRVSTKDQTKVTFEDVAGIDEAKEEVEEIIHFLRSPRKFQRLGGRIPRGVLLVGEPGCGKTLLAKAIAGEADVPFFSISGSDFVEMFVGVGASRVRDLFKQAKENAPCIIFLDEIDAVGRKRGVGMAGGGHDEREQTLNAILVEMDGFTTNDQVIVMAATNRGDILDHALTRPGRFDRQIYVPLPDIKGRWEILKVHARKIKTGPDVDLHRVARGTPMFSGADLEAIINEAALAATMLNKDCVELSDLEEARDKVRWGRARRSRVIDEQDKKTTAFHEAGHALVQLLLEHTDPLHKVSIIPRSSMGGATFSLPEKDRTMYTQQFCLALIKVCYGGRVAEEIFCGDVSSGAQSDIQQATEIARKMVMEWGMSDKLGFVHYGQEEGQGWLIEAGMGRDYSDRTAEIIDAEIKRIMDEAYQEVKDLLEKHRKQIEALTDALLKYETLDGDEAKLVIEGHLLDKPTVGDLLEAEQKRLSAEETKPSAEKKEDSASDIISGPMPNPGLS